MSKILLPTDGSLPALAATMRAVKMAKDSNSDLIVLKVVGDAPIVETERIAEDSMLQRAEFEDGISFAKELASKNKVSVEVLVKEGAVVGEILKAAEETRSDMIVMGTSSPRGMSRLYLGSVAGAVISGSKITVVVVKPTSDEIAQIKTLLKKKVVEEAPTDNVRAITRTRQFKVGVWLFVIYGIGYAIFTVIGAYYRSVFKADVFGINVGILAGLLLIVITIVLAISFNWYAGRAEAEG